MKKHIIREVEPDCSTFETFFDDDGLTEKSGEWNNTLFIVSRDYGRYSGFNIDEYKRIMEQAESVLDGFQDVQDGLTDYDGKKYTYKSIMQENGIKYSPTKCSKLKKWAESAEYDDVESIAEYLRIITGEYWKVTSAHGYCQGDYCEVLYSGERYTNARKYGEVWLGAAKEFCVIELDGNGEEIDSCYGYIVADCEAWKDEQYKSIVSEWAGINPDDAELQMIDGYSVQTVYKYRTT